MTVPRIWQKIQDNITYVMKKNKNSMQSKMFRWATQKGAKITHSQFNNISLSPSQLLCKKLVFDKVKKGLGLEHVKMFMFGAAPIKKSTRLFFLKMNILLINGYGMSQTSGPHCFTEPDIWNSFENQEFLRETGRCLPGCDLQIKYPDQFGIGQVCMRGRNVFMGYFKDEKQTRNTIDDKGFIHSGDIGSIDQNRSLSITGRIKELIVTAGGENIAPLYIQDQFHLQLPIFSHVIVVGDKRKYLGALLCLKANENNILQSSVVEYLSKRGCKARRVSEATRCPVLKDIIQQKLDLINQNALSHSCRVQRFIILPQTFSMQAGTLTHSQKVKRQIVYQIFKDYIQMLYISVPSL